MGDDCLRAYAPTLTPHGRASVANLVRTYARDRCAPRPVVATAGGLVVWPSASSGASSGTACAPVFQSRPADLIDMTKCIDPGDGLLAQDSSLSQS